MKNVKLHNVSSDEIHALQTEINEYQNHVQKSLSAIVNYNDFLNAITTFDIAFRLWFLFRTRIEKVEKKKGFTISFRVSEAAVLQKVCTFNNPLSGHYEINVKEKYKLLIDQQLKSMLL